MVSKVKSGETVEITETIEFVLVECCKCATPFFMTKRLNAAFRANKETFCCPFGHQQGYYGKNTEDKLRDRIEQLEKKSLEEKEVLQNRWLDEMSRANKLDKQLKRIHKGVCPCCNRSFQNLKRHMETKHPDFKK